MNPKNIRVFIIMGVAGLCAWAIALSASSSIPILPQNMTSCDAPKVMVNIDSLDNDVINVDYSIDVDNACDGGYVSDISMQLPMIDADKYTPTNIDSEHVDVTLKDGVYTFEVHGDIRDDVDGTLVFETS